MQLTKELSTSEDALRGLCGQITCYHAGTRATTASVAQRLSAFSSKLDERAGLEVCACMHARICAYASAGLEARLEPSLTLTKAGLGPNPNQGRAGA